MEANSEPKSSVTGAAGHRELGHGHDHDHGEHGHESDHHHEDWNSEEFVEGWLERQKDRQVERRGQFALVRALIPKAKDSEFRYLNIGAGPGNLEEVLLDHFPGAQATLVDASFVMLSTARRALARFGDRVEYVQADLSKPEWAGALGGSFDIVVSINAIHHFGDPRRIRALYRELYGLLAHGGLFLDLDYMRPAQPVLADLGRWASRDPEAGLSGNGPGDLPGTVAEHLGWLTEAGYGAADVVWKNMNVAALCAVRDHLHLPDDHDHGAGHSGHSH